MKIPFNKPYMTGTELEYIRQAHEAGHLAGDGMFTKKCQLWLEENTGCEKALLTHSCTAALEMAAILARVGERGDLDLPGTLNALLEVGYDGMAAVELSRDSHRGAWAAEVALASLRAALAPGERPSTGSA